MNKLYTFFAKNKKLSLFALFIILVYGCRKDITNSTNNSTSAQSAKFTIDQAKAWYQKSASILYTPKLSANSITPSLANALKITSIDWDSATTTADSMFYVVEADAKMVHSVGYNFSDPSDKNKTNDYVRILILKNAQSYEITPVLMHINTEASGVNFSKIHYRDIPNNFTGNIFYTNLQGDFINGFKYKGGQIIANSKSNGSQTKSDLKIQLLPDPGGQPCSVETIYLFFRDCEVIVYPDGVEADQGCGEWIPNGSVTITTCSGGGGGGGSGGVSTTLAERAIANAIKNKCLQAMAQIALNNGISNDVATTVNSIYGTTGFPHLILRDAALPADTDAKTTTSYYSDGSYATSLTLNSSTLPTASAEYITATIFHEFGHTIINSATTSSSSEQALATQYVSKIALAIKDYYSITMENATALAWGGLTGTQAFQDLIRTDPALAQKYVDINKQYKEGKLGTKPCVNLSPAQ